MACEETIPTMKPKTKTAKGRRAPERRSKRSLQIDLASILSVDHTCDGCSPGEICCCAHHEVCVTKAELARIINLLPEASAFCPHLRSGEGYDNVFEEVELGLYAIDTTEDGLCLFAFVSDQKIRCSLHAVATAHGMPLAKVKPAPCLLWPLSLSEGDEVLLLADNAFEYKCTSQRRKRSKRLSAAFAEAIELVYGAGCGAHAAEEARRGRLRTTLPR